MKIFSTDTEQLSLNKISMKKLVKKPIYFVIHLSSGYTWNNKLNPSHCLISYQIYKIIQVQEYSWYFVMTILGKSKRARKKCIPLCTHKGILKGSIWGIDFKIASRGTWSISEIPHQRPYNKNTTVVEIKVAKQYEAISRPRHVLKT